MARNSITAAGDRGGVSSRRRARSSFQFRNRHAAALPRVRRVESSTSLSATMTRRRSVSASIGTLAFGLGLLARSSLPAQTPQTLAVPPDSPRWELEGEARPAEYQGRKCLLLDGGAA